MEEINIKEFLMYIKKYIGGIIGIALFLAFCMVLYDKLIKVPNYSTYTTIVLVKNEDITDITESNTINQNDITLNQKLVATYRQIIKSKLVIEQVINNLNLNYSYSELYNMIKVEAMDETEILKITVTDRNATRAANIANNLAEVFEREVTKIYKINNVSVIDKAVVNNNPANNTLIRDVVLAIMVGVVGSVAFIFVLFYFDDILRYTDNLADNLDMPLIGKVGKDNSGIELVVDKKPKAITSENIRTIRTNLQFSSVDKKVQTVLITSTIPSEGKSYVSSNLAVSFAQAGKSVLLIDCDLRKGRQHKIFKVGSKQGLSNLLVKDIADVAKYVIKTNIDNLFLLPRGVFPPNPSELLGSHKMKSLLRVLKQNFDLVILDGAPCNGLSDSLVLSSMVDKVLIVSCVNYTPKTELKGTKKSLEQVGASIAGCIVNNVNPKRDGYSNYRYHYGYGYGYDNDEVNNS